MSTARYKDSAALAGISAPSSTSVRAKEDPYGPRTRTRFTKDAVKIAVPSNPKSVDLSVMVQPLTAGSDKSHSYNPYSSRISSRSSPKGNRSRDAQTVFGNWSTSVSDASVPPPMKKRRVEEASSVRRIETNKPTLRTVPSLSCATGEDDKDPIDVISDEEDERMKPVTLANSRRREGGAGQPPERVRAQSKSEEELSAFRSVRDPADNPVNERSHIPLNPSSSSVPAQSASGSGKTIAITTSHYFPQKHAGNNVSTLSQAYEAIEDASRSSGLPELAGFKPKKKTSSMQPKGAVANRPIGLINGRHGAARDAIATKTSHFQATTATTQRLPLRAAIIGPQLFTSDWDNQYWLYFTHKLLTLRRCSAGEEVILLKQPLDEVCDLKATLKRETEKTYMLGVESNFAMLTLEGEEQRALRRASFTFMLDQSHSGWNLGGYGAFLLLAYPSGAEFVTSDAADSIWQHEIENHHRSSGRRCSSPPPPQQLPDLEVAHRTIDDDRVHGDDYSMTARRQTRSKSVGTYTASGNPSRLKPRPRPRPKTTALKSPSPQPCEPEPDPDEIILVYPPAVTGAVNLTNGVMRRLQPGEFLNDTLIEFGLKLWLHRLRQQNPELADEIHIFSSFFYKKLKSAKQPDGYKSVRKWTARFDVFKKKFLIVPINENVHWYLAIICYPEHSLLEPLEQSRVNRKSPRRAAVVEEEETMVLNAPSPELQYPLLHAESSTDADNAPTDAAGVPSEVDGVVESTRNVSLNDDVRMTSPEREESPELRYPARVIVSEVAGKMEVDGAVAAKSRESSPLTEFESDPEEEIEKKKVLRTEIDPGEAEDLENKKPLQTMIFTLDSMGSKHTQAVRNLAKYLENEAMDKKSIKQIRKAFHNTIKVPFQPNFCDCGIYLLHFASTFMQNTERAYTIMANQKKGKSADEEDFWQGDTIKDFRNTLLQDIETLSREWKANQFTKDADDKIAKEPSTKDGDTRRSEDPLQSDKEVEKMTSTVVPASEEDDDVEIVQVVQAKKRRSRRARGIFV